VLLFSILVLTCKKELSPSGSQAQRGLLILAFSPFGDSGGQGSHNKPDRYGDEHCHRVPYGLQFGSGAIMPQKIMVSQALRKKKAPAAGIAGKPMTHLLEKVLYGNRDSPSLTCHEATLASPQTGLITVSPSVARFCVATILPCSRLVNPFSIWAFWKLSRFL